MTLTSETKYRAKRYTRYLTSGCAICWDSCSCTNTNKNPPGPSTVGKADINAYNRAGYGG